MLHDTQELIFLPYIKSSFGLSINTCGDAQRRLAEVQLIKHKPL